MAKKKSDIPIYDAEGWGGTDPQVRTFDTGATRDADEDKPEYAGFSDPIVWIRFGEYMHRHRFQKDGTKRASDNWKKGIPREVYIQSMFRHFIDLWSHHQAVKEDLPVDDDVNYGIEEALCALLFNVQGYLYEQLKANARG